MGYRINFCLQSEHRGVGWPGSMTGCWQVIHWFGEPGLSSSGSRVGSIVVIGLKIGCHFLKSNKTGAGLPTAPFFHHSHPLNHRLPAVEKSTAGDNLDRFGMSTRCQLDVNQVSTQHTAFPFNRLFLPEAGTRRVGNPSKPRVGNPLSPILNRFAR